MAGWGSLLPLRISSRVAARISTSASTTSTVPVRGGTSTVPVRGGTSTVPVRGGTSTVPVRGGTITVPVRGRTPAARLCLGRVALPQPLVLVAAVASSVLVRGRVAARVG